MRMRRGARSEGHAPTSCTIEPRDRNTTFASTASRGYPVGYRLVTIGVRGRNETIAVTPPKIFFKEVAQNRPPHFLARTSSPPEIVLRHISGDGAGWKS